MATRPGPAPLDASRLRRACTLAGLSFATTEELADLGELPGQGRAIEAIRFGVAMPHAGYNPFVLGPPGSGRGTAVRQLLGAAAAGRLVPGDWCYVNNFADPARPRALALPAGRGRALRDEVARLVDELRTVIPGIFEREEFRGRVEEINAEFAAREHQALSALAEDATARQVVLMRTPGGFVLAPAKDGEAMEPEAFAKLPEAERDRLGKVIAALEERLGRLLRQIPQWMRERRERLRALERQYVMTAVGQAIDDLVAHFSDLPDVLAWIEALRADVIDNAGAFRASPEEGPGPMPAPGGDLRRYQVNLLVDHAATPAAPVVHEEHPTHHNLLGRVEHFERFGALSTDFTLIRGGALHRANGGYLVLDARQLLSQPFAWDSLKRAAHPGDPPRVRRADAEPRQHSVPRAPAPAAGRQGRPGRRAAAVLPAVRV
jgi:hypothetical protein